LHEVVIPVTRQETCKNFETVKGVNRDEIEDAQKNVKKDYGGEVVIDCVDGGVEGLSVESR